MHTIMFDTIHSKESQVIQNIHIQMRHLDFMHSLPPGKILQLPLDLDLMETLDEKDNVYVSCRGRKNPPIRTMGSWSLGQGHIQECKCNFI